MDGFQSSTILFLKFRASIFSVSTLCLSVRGPRFTVLYCITNWKLYFTGSGCVWQTVTLSAAAVIFMIKLTAECSDGSSCVTLSAAALIFMIKLTADCVGGSSCVTLSAVVVIFMINWQLTACVGGSSCVKLSAGAVIFMITMTTECSDGSSCVRHYQLPRWYFW